MLAWRRATAQSVFRNLDDDFVPMRPMLSPRSWPVSSIPIVLNGAKSFPYNANDETQDAKEKGDIMANHCQGRLSQEICRESVPRHLSDQRSTQVKSQQLADGAIEATKACDAAERVDSMLWKYERIWKYCCCLKHECLQRLASWHGP